MIQKLSQITKVAPGHPFRGSVKEKPGAGVFVVQLKDVSLGGPVNWEACMETTLTSKKEPDWLQEGDILFSSRGKRYFAVLASGMNIARKYVPVPHFYVLRIKSDLVLAEFLVWLLNQKPCQQYFEKQAEGSVTKSIRRTLLADTPITLPPIEKQRTIVQLDKTLKKEQQRVLQLIQNGENLMNTISKNLYATGNQ